MANPMYRQIAEDLRAEIEGGSLKPGQQLPTELELRERFNASRNTVRDAIKWLMNLGLVETRPGQGTYVMKKIAPFVTTLSGDPAAGDNEVFQYQVSQEGRTPSSSQVVVEIQKASSAVAAELGIPEGSQVVSRHQRRFIDETEWSLQTSFYPMGLALQGANALMLADNIERGAVQYLADTLGLRQMGYRDWITVRAPDATEARFFNLPADGRVAVFEVFRTAFDQTHTPMRVTITVFPTDRNQFIATTGDVPEPKVIKPAEKQQSLAARATALFPSGISPASVDTRGTARTTREPTRPGHGRCHGPHRAYGGASNWRRSGASQPQADHACRHDHRRARA